MRQFKFRVWNKIYKEFLFDKELSLYINGKFQLPLGWHNDHKPDPNFEDFVWMQSTTLKDKNKKEVFEGDIVKFKYWVGDFAWEFMDEEEAKSNDKIDGKEFVGVVEWNDTIASFELICGSKDSTHTMFPLTYVKNGEILGNIFQNQDLLKLSKWYP